MSRLPITIATWDYDRVRAICDGRVQVEGCDVNYITMPVEECFERAFFHGEFEVAEIGFSPYLIALSRGVAPYVAVPAFLSRMFRHSAVYIRTDRGIEGPADLRGKTIGVPEYQMSAVMWFRGYLQDEFGIGVGDINWVQAGLENPGRRDKFPLNLPAGFPLVSRNDVALSTIAGQRRDRRGYFGAAAVVLHQRPRQNPSAVSRLSHGREGILQAYRHLPDHACGRHSPRRSRQAPLACRQHLQGVPAGQTGRRRRIRRDHRAQDRLAMGDGRIRGDHRGHGRGLSGPTASRPIVTMLSTMARYSYEQRLAVRVAGRRRDVRRRQHDRDQGLRSRT